MLPFAIPAYVLAFVFVGLLDFSGPVQMLVADCTSELRIRGLARHQGELPQGSERALFGDGRLALTLEDSESQEYDSLETEVKKVDEHLKRLNGLQETIKASAIVVDGKAAPEDGGGEAAGRAPTGAVRGVLRRAAVRRAGAAQGQAGLSAVPGFSA